ncbi:MAG TPA: hypothetical protein PK360_12585 [bacterium]|nr:hypothetical protein [bacterium]
MAIVLPGVVYLASAAALGIPVMLLAGGYWWKPALTGYLIFLVCLYTLHAVSWHVEKALWVDLERVRPGMTAAEVDRVLAGYIKESAAEEPGSPRGEAPPAVAVQTGVGDSEYASAAEFAPGPGSSGNVIYRPSRPGAGQERCVIRFQGDRVVSVEILRD